MSTMIERVARAIGVADLNASAKSMPNVPMETMAEYVKHAADEGHYEAMARAAIEAMMEPTNDELDAVRHLVQWHTFARPTEAALIRHCKALRKAAPEDCREVDHVPPTNMVSYWIFRGIIQTILKESA
jgi:hypothetical protein